MSVLVPCSTCRRHVRRTEVACPFCAAEMPSAAPALPAVRAAVTPGAKRAAAFAMGVTLAASACEPDTNPVPIYGAPWVPEAGSSGAGGNLAGNGGNGGTGGRNGGAGGNAADAPDADAPDADAPDADVADADAPDADAAP